jgi:hypothetical protein
MANRPIETSRRLAPVVAHSPIHVDLLVGQSDGAASWKEIQSHRRWRRRPRGAGVPLDLVVVELCFNCLMPNHVCQAQHLSLGDFVK